MVWMKTVWGQGCILIKRHPTGDPGLAAGFYTILHILGRIDSTEDNKNNGKSTIYDFVRICLELDTIARLKEIRFK